MLKMVDAHPMDAMYLAPKLRAIDNLEVRATGRTPYEALKAGFDLPNSKVMSGLNTDEQVVFMCGSVQCPNNTEAGIVWMLASDELEDTKKDFLKLCEPTIKSLCEGYKYVYNFVHVTNEKSIRWLKWNGFTVDTENTYEQGGEDFYLLSKET